MGKKKFKETLKEFNARQGIMHPIRAIVLRNKTLEDIVTTACFATEAFYTTNNIDANDPQVDKTTKENVAIRMREVMWKKYFGKSNIVGYFAAQKNLLGDIEVSYSFCKPEDWHRYKSVTAKSIAISGKNLLYTFHTKGNTQKLLENNHPHVDFTYAGVDDKGDTIVFIMLGYFDIQFMDFLKRVKKYYNITCE